MFTPKEYGQPIKQTLGDILRMYLSRNTYGEIARRSGVSISTVRDLIYRTNALTENNAKAMEEAVYIAEQNAKRAKQNAQQALGYFKSIKKGA